MVSGIEHYEKHGVCEEDSYKYKAKNEKCEESKCKKASFKVGGVTNVKNSVASLKSACDK